MTETQEIRTRTIYAGDVGEWIGNAGFAAFVVLLALAALTWGAVAVTYSARASGSPDYCLPKVVDASMAVPSYRLYAHRPWSNDIVVGAFASFTETAAAADRLGCPFRTAP